MGSYRGAIKIQVPPIVLGRRTEVAQGNAFLLSILGLWTM